MFDGKTYARDADFNRLKTSLEKVRYVLSKGITDKHPTGHAFTLKELEAIIGGSQTGLSARARDLNKDKFKQDNCRVEAKRVSGGTWVYQMIKEPAFQQEMFI